MSHPVRKPAGSRIAASQSTAKPLVSFSLAQAASTGTGARVLILADTDVVATSALASSLADAGLQVTLRPGPEWSWDGTNPSLSGFDAVIHLNGATYDVPLSDAAQNALASFVANGGGYVGAKWNGFEDQLQMTDLVLQGFGGDQTCGHCQITYEAVAAAVGHPVLAGIPVSFTFTADGHDAGPRTDFASNPSTVLMEVPSGSPDVPNRPAVLVREFGTGRVVNFSFAPNYYWNDLGQTADPEMLQNATIQHLYLNAVQWAAGAASGGTAQNITFGPLANKVYGDPAFTLGATASSGLPVSYTASGSCEVQGATVTITGAGSCTITAQQPGNQEYQAAADVSRSFFIAKGPATISLSGLSQAYDGTVKSAIATSAPAGLAVVTLKYSQGGVQVEGPTAQGSYQVIATLDNPNYQAPAATGTLVIGPAVPTIEWQPARISVGTALGPAQLNAVAYGLGGVPLSGSFLYDPPAGTKLKQGTQTLSVQFTPTDVNYTAASKSVVITVELGFKGFHPPVKNQPTVNVVAAGSSIPMKFSLEEYAGSQILSGTPTSIPVNCGGVEFPILGGTTSVREGLTAVGYTYTYLWKTNPTWAGSCRKFILTLTDGSTHEAVFRFPVRSTTGTAARRITRR